MSALAEKWAADLRSGEYRQGEAVLREGMNPTQALAEMLGIRADDVHAYRQGILDGQMRGSDFVVGMSYPNLERQRAYDAGIQIGILSSEFK